MTISLVYSEVMHLYHEFVTNLSLLLCYAHEISLFLSLWPTDCFPFVSNALGSAPNAQLEDESYFADSGCNESSIKGSNNKNAFCVCTKKTATGRFHAFCE